MAGKFIVFSGLDASGKTTNLQHVDSLLTKAGVDFARTREPGGTMFAEKMRSLILDPASEIPPLSEVLSFYAARVDHTEKVIQPYLNRGYHVLCDRYYDSSLAYQSVFCNETRAIHTACLSHLCVPDLTILYDVPAEVSAARLQSERGTLDRIERLGAEYFSEVRANFLELAVNDPNTLIVDGTQPIRAVLEETASIISKFLEIDL